MTDFPPITGNGRLDGDLTDSQVAGMAFPEFEGYQIVQELPRGGQAVVYKATHKATKTKVALKVLLPGLTISKKARQLFEREVDLISSLNHPYVVSVRDSGILSGQYFFTMEYIRGVPLDRYVHSKGLHHRNIMELFAKVGEAIAHAHQHGVIHRDLKPSNILVDNRGDPHVLDFGMAKAAAHFNSGPNSVSLPSMTGEIKGTLSYMSPEQASGRTDLVDVRTDVYSIGVIMYQTLAGQFPYDVSGTTTEVLKNIESVEPTRLRQIISRVDKDMEAIINKCLEKDPSLRYHSAADLTDDIRRWLNNEPLNAKSHSSIYVLCKLARRHRNTALVLGLLLVIILTVTYTVGGYYSGIALAAREEKAASQRLVGKMNKSLGESLLQVSFIYFLDAWHREDSNDIQMMSYVIRTEHEIQGNVPKKSKEFIGLEYLTSAPSQWAIMEDDLLKSLPHEQRWFADFVAAECYTKRGEYKLAAERYQNSLQAQQESGVVLVIGDRLYTRWMDSMLYKFEKGMNTSQKNVSK